MAAEGKKSSQSLQFPAFEPAKLTDKQYRRMEELKLSFIEINGHTGSMSNYTDKKCQEKKTGEARNSAKEHQKNKFAWRRTQPFLNTGRGRFVNASTGAIDGAPWGQETCEGCAETGAGTPCERTHWGPRRSSLGGRKRARGVPKSGRGRHGAAPTGAIGGATCGATKCDGCVLEQTRGRPEPIMETPQANQAL